MMMNSKMSAASFISIGNMSANVTSYTAFILCCIFLSWILTIQDLYSFFHRVIQLLSCLFFTLWKCWHDLTEKFNVNAKKSTSSESHPIHETCVNHNKSLNVKVEDIEMVMENLGLNRVTNVTIGNCPPKMSYQGSMEIAILFDEVEPSLDEVKEAFSLFDRNRDGFIDAEELKKVMNSIGLTGFSNEECERMIAVFDDNGDGKIDFCEFVKLMEDCSL